jgi:integrase/recombinase XerD
MEPTIARVEQDLIDLERSINTKKTYTQTLKRLHKHCGRPLDELGPEDVRDYLRMLIRSPDHGFATYSAFIAAARFCYTVTLSRHEVVAGLRCPRAPKKLPIVMSQAEIRRCFSVQMSHRDRALIMLAYGAGMRISEVRHLQISDIDSEHGVIHIRNGKGRKQRIVMLAGVLLIQLRRAWSEQRPEGAWLFPGLYPHMPLTARQIRRVWADIQMRAGLRKHYRFHGLRGSFATHLLDDGTDLRTIQVLLGHSHMSSTMRYVSVQAKHVSGVKSPLDTLVPHTA